MLNRILDVVRANGGRCSVAAVARKLQVRPYRVRRWLDAEPAPFRLHRDMVALELPHHHELARVS